mmetsp:Transcript_43548/g.49312  ORF Transcript_43548/g.49312 Transcript_43548/m.49312 type:complete len:662 (-) Transcript_43548:9-1994(-)
MILSHFVLLLFSLIILVDAFSWIHYNPERTTLSRHAKSRDSDDNVNEDDISNDDEDWRAFRAKLVMSEKKSNNEDIAPTSSSNTRTISRFTEELIDNELNESDLDGIGSFFRDDSEKNITQNNESTAGKILKDEMTPLDPSQWAYDSGDVIEQGAVILGGIEQDFSFGLRQQYFHKVAILVLDHSETFTKGIILNRPTDLMLEDDINKEKWRVWFGGDVEGMNARHPDIICLHSLKDEKATKASIPVMKDIQWTSFDNAKKLVKAGIAIVSDFWVFVGYAGWGPGQLKDEIERNSWYMVATDSQTLLKELAREESDPRDAGLETWTLLMDMIGRSKTAKQYHAEFDDLMLKEWALGNLLSTKGGGGAGSQQRYPDKFNTNPDLIEQLLNLSESRSKPSVEGALVSASGSDRSPFLLQKQEFHKSVVLILKDEKPATVGVILNRQSTKGIDIQVDDLKTGGKRIVTIPMRFGGPYSVQGQQSLLWIHNSKVLREASIGNPINDHQKNGIWKCTTKDVMKAVGQGIVSPEDFLAISGVSVWVKDDNEEGIQGEFELGNFEAVSESVENVWSLLMKQQFLLKESNFAESLKLSEEVWASTKEERFSKNGKNRGIRELLGGLGKNLDEENDALVFKSDYEVSQLSDDALRRWCAVFLLGLPNFEI